MLARNKIVLTRKMKREGKREKGNDILWNNMFYANAWPSSLWELYHKIHLTKIFFSLQHGGQTFAAWSTAVATPVESLWQTIVALDISLWTLTLI